VPSAFGHPAAGEWKSMCRSIRACFRYAFDRSIGLLARKSRPPLPEWIFPGVADRVAHPHAGGRGDGHGRWRRHGPPARRHMHPAIPRNRAALRRGCGLLSMPISTSS
jgi:hypothetical protein